MSKTLFQIEDSMMTLLDCGVDDETGEIIETQEEFDKLYESIQLELTTKLDNTNSLAKMVNSEVDLIDTEIKRLQALKKQKENTSKWLLDRIDFFIRKQFTDDDGVLDFEGLNKYKLDLPHGKISYRKSEVVEITDAEKLPKEYVKVEVSEKPDKTHIKSDIKAGVVIEGAELVKKLNMSVK